MIFYFVSFSRNFLPDILRSTFTFYFADDIKSKINRNLTDQLGVLVCTDDVLGDLDMRHAQHIIHFSLPDYWTQFTQRFLASFNYYENFVEDVSAFFFEFCP